MDAVFLKLLNMSITASWLILAVIVLRVLLKKAPKSIRGFLWALVGIRLVLPFSWESVLSLIPSAQTVGSDILYAEVPAIHSGISALNQAVNPVLSESLAPTAGASVNPMQVVAGVASVVWMVGMAALVLYGVVSYIRLRRRVAEAVILRDNLRQSEKVASPFVLGLFHPRVYLPFGLDGESLAYVVAHERAHIKRRDHWIKPIGFLLLAVYWFNPLVWLAYILLCRDIELACDERVVKEMGVEDKKAYSKALLSCSVPRRMIAACPLAFGEVGVKQRIKNVLNYKKPAFWIIVVALVSCVVVAVCFLTNPQTNEDPAKVVGEYDASSLGGAFLTSGNTAYQIGMNAYGMPVFINSDAAFDAILEDCGDGFAYLSSEFDLSAVTTQNYEDFKTYGWQTGASDEAVRRQCVEISQFFDIYENSFSTDRAVITTSTVETSVADGSSVYTGGALYDAPVCTVFTASGTQAVEASWYPDGDFDFDYDSLPVLDAAGADTLLFEASWDCETLTVGEDYYGSGNFIARNTFELKKNADGFFELGAVSRGGSDGDQAVYYILCGEGKFVIEVNFSAEENVDSLDAAVSAAILEYNESEYAQGDFACESHVTFDTLEIERWDEETDTAVQTVEVYIMALYLEFSYTDGGITETGGCHVPCVLTFDLVGGDTYELTDYWEPRDGTYYTPDIEKRFEQLSPEVISDALDTQKFILAQMQSCYAQAVEYGNVDTDDIIERLFETIMSSPATSSNPGDYIEEHPIEYRELTYYCDYTLQYVFSEFLKGGQTGLKGHLMRIVMDELAPESQLRLHTETGQEYFDVWRSEAEELESENGLAYMKKNTPAMYLLLQML